MFALGIEFLTGTAVMTSADTRDTAEWPPHPARVFMALVAAHYETHPVIDDGREAFAEWSEERLCLEWLEEQSAPALAYSEVPKEHRRTVVKVYVPVNDTGLSSRPASVKASEMRYALGVMPAFRSRQERTFPAVGLGLENQRNCVHLVWNNAELPPVLQPAFKRLAAKVVRIGHSSSLTSVWVAEQSPLPQMALFPSEPSKGSRGGMKLRSIAPGFLADLDQRFNASDIDAFFELSQKIQTATGAAAKKTAKAAFKERFNEDWAATLSAPVRRLPSVGTSQTYTPPVDDALPCASSVFDPELLVLTKLDGRVLGLESTNMLVEALRGTLLTGSETAPPWFTGHREHGEPAAAPHLAVLPLAFVGGEYADGHVLGMALAFPKAVSSKERAGQLKRVLFDADGADKDVILKLGRHGTWKLQREDRAPRSRPLSLCSETWTEASTIWASVTPVVLDRHPKFDPADPKEREAWRREVTEIIRTSCANIGLPCPASIDLDRTSWHRGAPRARPGPNGMPWLSSKTGNSRQQVHVLLHFDSEVEGPVLIGAGRYRGYGVCKPLGLPPS
ncbi:CRISPR-associated protein Csb2 [Roseimicrobium gellanilyticum]|uniref:CRISPR-associated protein Csb2 n=1 Tax=Roseimicrobium gellanilyticum TaxID=748857 RepID=A0A366H8M1_9BACT|nr:type I-U CRISPR-associated protein Csb2 [Roseimicrobium gellanilyticum]RBP38119.1 CRISPR-associated protein Csb2 [Roseimicrobium gellanilyticum]